MQRWASWTNRSTAVGALGTCVACVVWGPVQVGVLFAVVSVVVIVIFAVAADDQGTLRRWATWSHIGRIAVSMSTVLVSISLAGQLAPALSLLTTVVWVVSAPPIWGRVASRARREATATPSAEARAEALPRSGAAVFTDEELCRAWLRTSQELSSTTDPDRRLALVITRQHLLDEVWTRDRRRLEHWVECGARATDQGSRRYFDPS